LAAVPTRDLAAGLSQSGLSFAARLGQFLERDVDASRRELVPARSRMSFWCLGPIGRKYGPKSATLIREILERIRRAVHGSPGPLGRR
jgi:hypothetical protein